MIPLYFEKSLKKILKIVNPIHKLKIFNLYH